MAVQCVLVGKGKDDVFTAIYGETTFDKVLKAYNEKKVVQMIYQNRTYYLDNTTVIGSPEAFSFISSFSNQNDENGEIKHHVITLMSGDNWSGPFLQKSTPATHAKTHTKNGTDPLAPADIGAMELSGNALKQSNEDITSQVAQALSGDLVPFSGGTMTGLLNVLTPIGDSNATTKKYVDDALSKKIGMDGIGDLHVWKKTVVNSQAIAAGYTLGEKTQLNVATRTNSNSSTSSYINYVHIADSISVNNAGVVALVNDQISSNKSLTISGSGIYYNGDSVIGKYIMFDNTQTRGFYCTTLLSPNKIYYIPNDAQTVGAGYSYGNTAYFTKAQLVTGYPYQPAGTTTTYPVSTNRNAYQEGSNAKPAGYTLGDVVTGKYYLGNANVGYVMSYKTATSLSVSDDGILSMPTDATSFNVTYSKNGLTTDQIKSYFAGKFVQLVAVGSDSVFSPSSLFKTAPSEILFIPSNSVVTKDEFKNFNIDRYQPVTGYAAIPANTTIEYLGCLGEKARTQVVSYVGTGTYGASNPCSLTFDFPPKVVILLGAIDPNGKFRSLHEWDSNYIDIRIPSITPTTFTAYYGFGQTIYAAYQFGRVSTDGKIFYWYGSYSAFSQLNESNYTYYYLGIG